MVIKLKGQEIKRSTDLAGCFVGGSFLVEGQKVP